MGDNFTVTRRVAAPSVGESGVVAGVNVWAGFENLADFGDLSQSDGSDGFGVVAVRMSVASGEWEILEASVDFADFVDFDDFFGLVTPAGFADFVVFEDLANFEGLARLGGLVASRTFADGVDFPARRRVTILNGTREAGAEVGANFIFGAWKTRRRD